MTASSEVFEVWPRRWISERASEASATTSKHHSNGRLVAVGAAESVDLMGTLFA